jgi:hypothetical protein
MILYIEKQLRCLREAPAGDQKKPLRTKVLSGFEI